MNRKYEAKRPVILTTLVLLILLPLLYVLSVGPCTWFASRGYVDTGEGSFFPVLYSPLRWVCVQDERLFKVMFWYNSLFLPS